MVSQRGRSNADRRYFYSSVFGRLLRSTLNGQRGPASHARFVLDSGDDELFTQDPSIIADQKEAGRLGSVNS